MASTCETLFPKRCNVTGPWNSSSCAKPRPEIRITAQAVKPLTPLCQVLIMKTIGWNITTFLKKYFFYNCTRSWIQCLTSWNMILSLYINSQRITIWMNFGINNSNKSHLAGSGWRHWFRFGNVFLRQLLQ